MQRVTILIFIFTPTLFHFPPLQRGKPTNNADFIFYIIHVKSVAKITDRQGDSVTAFTLLLLAVQ